MTAWLTPLRSGATQKIGPSREVWSRAMRRVSNRSWTVAGIGVVLIVAAFSLSRAFGPLLAGGGVLLILAAYLAWGDLRSGPRLDPRSTVHRRFEGRNR
jgi:hypothetical protein